MSLDAYFTLGVVAMIFSLLLFSRLATDVILIAAVTVLMVVGILTPNEALAGMANEGMITVGVLFIVGAGVIETGGITFVAEKLFGHPKTAQGAIFRMMTPTAILSGFMNNTPLVAMLIPAVGDWAKKHQVAPSKVMMPLSIAAIIGGTCTMIGTSTNLVVNGMLIKAAAVEGQVSGPEAERLKAGLNMFELGWVGIPSAICVIAIVVIASRWLLPNRKPALSQMDDPRQYTVEMLVERTSPLVGKTIEEAGLRHLPGVYLAEIDRQDVVLPAVGPQEKLLGGDRLVFVGVVDSVVELQKIRGLVPATDQVFKLSSPRSSRCLIEAVVSDTCPLVGKTIRDGRFRSTYNAAIIAVARNGERINKKIGDIVLATGDTLLLEAHPSFAEANRNSRDFFLVSRLEGSNPPSHDRAPVALAILLAMVVVVTLSDIFGELRLLGLNLGKITMLKAGMIASGLMLATRCCTVSTARKHVDWEVLLAIAASFAVGTALEKTGAAKVVADSMIGLAQGSPWFSLAVIYFITLLATELITNNAAAALMFPLSLATARGLGDGGVNCVPFVVAVMMAASNGFATPIGYQTNLMVYGPGGYRFSDYVRIGVPLDIVVGVITVALAPLVWPF